VFVEDHHVVVALVLDIMDGLIVGVRAVSNPDKLERLSSQLRATTDVPEGPASG
jgi:hypothetical protein